MIVATMVRLAHVVADAVEWSGADRGDLLHGLDRAVDGLVAVRAKVLVAERDAGTWRGDGDRSFEVWRARTGGTDRRGAITQVRQAGQLDAAPAAVAAVVDGRIGLEHAATIGAVAGFGSPERRQAAASEHAQADLLRLAERMDAGSFAVAVDRWASTVDPVELERDHQRQRAERFLHVSCTPHGTYLKGRLDTIAGRHLSLALEALSPRPAVDDDRDPGQRRADALDAMATRLLALTDTKPGGHVPPQISMILTEETWAAARAERDRRRRLGPAAGRSGSRTRSPGTSATSGTEISVDTGGTPSALGTPGAPGAPGAERIHIDATGADATDAGIHRAGRSPASSVAVPEADTMPYAPATFEDGAPVPVSELAAAMCDCEITRIVVDADGSPVDVGRAQRLFTGPQRRAIIARDRHCGWPECDAPARWCEVHHIAWWERDGGRTSVENGILLCSYHHHEVHRRDLTITRVAAGDARAGDGQPPGGALRPVTQVAYRFRDPTGRVVGRSGCTTRRDVGSRSASTGSDASASGTSGTHRSPARPRSRGEPDVLRKGTAQTTADDHGHERPQSLARPRGDGRAGAG